MLIKTVSVWLILVDGDNVGKVALQRRAADENSFPYVCQATWSGKIEAGETVNEALVREEKEEMGIEFFDDFDKIKLTKLPKSRQRSNECVWECFNYFGKVESSLLAKARLHKGAFSEFVFVSKNDVFSPLKSNKDPKNNIVLFSDQCEVLKEIFKEY